MLVRKSRPAPAMRTWLPVVVACAVAALLSAAAWAGGLGRNSAVGGILVDFKGVVRNPTVDDRDYLRELRLEGMQALSKQVNQPSELRMVSLRRLEEAISQAQQAVQPLSDEIRFLAGLQRVQYVFVYPETNDIVLAGYGEGWEVDPRGNVVGVNTGRPVLLLDDLLVALRTVHQAAGGSITCSIDPTSEGLASLQAFVSQQQALGPDTIAGIEESLGLQNITVQGVPATSHFARVLVGADYRMKRLAMNLDKPLISGMPSFLHMISGGGSLENMLPRWWLTTNYESLLKDPSGLAWELRGPGVQAMTEDSFLAENGQLQQTGKANPLAQKWADTMTARYDDISQRDPIFGELRNVMDLAVVSALIVKEDLAAKAGFSMPLLLDELTLSAEILEAPQQVPTIASAVKQRRGVVVSASGGVEILPFSVVEQAEESPALAAVQQQSAAGVMDLTWWWNAQAE